MLLKQKEADDLIALPKKRVNSDTHAFPPAGGRLHIPICSADERIGFLLDLARGKIRLTQATYQTRYQRIVILVRLDIDGRPHTNPDTANPPMPYLSPLIGKTIPCPHLHRYIEGFDDKWAIPAPVQAFRNTTDLQQALQDFFAYCNIKNPPMIEAGLFI